MGEFSLTGFASFLSGAVVELDHVQHQQMERACQTVEEEVKRVIGVGYDTWPPLAPSTVAKKGHDRPLEETGELRESIRHSVSAAGALGHTVEGHVGSDLDRAVYNELGTSHAPPRSFLAEGARHVEAEVVKILGQGSIAPLLTGRGAL